MANDHKESIKIGDFNSYTALPPIQKPIKKDGNWLYTNKIKTGAWVGQPDVVNGEPKLIDWQYYDGANLLINESEIKP